MTDNTALCAIGILVYIDLSHAISGTAQCHEIPVIQFDMIASPLRIAMDVFAHVYMSYIDNWFS